MDLINQIGIGGYSLFGAILPFLFVLTIVVFFHELGHYLVGRWNNVDAEAFAVGFGPEIIGFNDKNNTRWKLCVIPLGGYVKFAGDMNAASVPDHEKMETLSADERQGSFPHKNVWQRSAVVLAGPIANFILAAIIFAGLFYAVGRTVQDPVISEVVDGSPAYEAGFQSGDVIKAINGNEIENFLELQRIIGPNHGIELQIAIERAGELLTIPVTPRLTEREDSFGNKIETGVLGIVGRGEDTNPRRVEFSVPGALAEGVREVGFVIKRTFQFLSGIIVGRESAEQLSGPIGIAQTANQFWSIGFTQLVYLTGLLSVSIGFVNLLPIPMLDGGHLVFYAIEVMRGRPMKRELQERAFFVGMIMLLSLMLFATRNDIMRLVG